jgi:hypothetical protein
MHPSQFAGLAAQAVASAPPLFVTPADPSVVLPADVREQLQQALLSSKPGSVFVCDCAVKIYHQVDGLWILSEDLANFHSPQNQSVMVDDGENDTDEEGD